MVVCDVEGYEEILLVPEKIPALARATLLVEMHDCFRPGVTELIAERLAPRITFNASGPNGAPRLTFRSLRSAHG